MLFRSYHLWAPAVIVPVTYGIFSKARGRLVARQIAITMVVATLATIAFNLTRFASSLEPAVFGVLVSAAVLLVCRTCWRDPTGEQFAMDTCLGE